MPLSSPLCPVLNVNNASAAITPPVTAIHSSAHANRVALPTIWNCRERNVLIVPDDLPFEHVALIEPSTVARHMLALGDFKAGETAVVLGAGSIGLMIVQWLRILGASLIICTDISDENLATARKLGAHVTLNPLTRRYRRRSARTNG